MVDIWDQFQDAPADPYEQFADAPAPRTSQLLGFLTEAKKPLDNTAMALETGVNRLGAIAGLPKLGASISHAAGMPSAVQSADQRVAYLTQKEREGVVPGRIGKFAGDALGTIPASIVSRNPLVVGALTGAALTDSRSPLGVALDAGIGAVAGKVADKAIGAAANVVKPYVQPAVKILKDAGVRMTPGQVAGGRAMIREDKLMSRPVVGERITADRARSLDDFNLAAVNRALGPLGVRVPAKTAPGHDAIQFADDAVNAAYNRVIPQLSLRVSPEALTERSALDVPQHLQGEFQRIVQRTVGGGELGGRALKNAEGELRRLASSYARSQDPAQRELGFALGRVHDRMWAAITAQNPAAGPELRLVNRAFRGLATVEDAASRADAGVFTTGQLKQAVRRGDSSARKGASARGAAFMQDFSDAARQVLPSKYPDSGTAGRSAGILANVRGAADLAGYRARQGVQSLMDAPRPANAQQLSDWILRNRLYLGLPAPVVAAQR